MDEATIGRELDRIQKDVSNKWDRIHHRLSSLNLEETVSVDANCGQSPPGEDNQLIWSYDNDERKLMVRMSGKGIHKQTIYLNLVDAKIGMKIKMLKFAMSLVEAAIEEGKRELAENRDLLLAIEADQGI